MRPKSHYHKKKQKEDWVVEELTGWKNNERGCNSETKDVELSHK